MTKRFLFLFAATLLSVQVFSQNFLGYNYSNFQTAGGMVFNPASIADSRFKVSINLFSLNAAIANNGYEIGRGSIFKSGDMLEGVDFFKLNNNSPKSLYFNVDVLGPSFMVDLGHKVGAFGISTRARFLTNQSNLDNSIFQLFGDSNAEFFGKTFKQNDFLSDVHGFTDFGLTYARTLWQNQNHVIKGGATLKYILGMASSTIRVNNMSIRIDQVTNMEEDIIKDLKGDISILYTKGVDDILSDNGKLMDVWSQTENNGWGFDVGFEYEWHSKGTRVSPVTNNDDRVSNILTPYTLKVSMSLTDVGSVKYTPSGESRNYHINMSNVSVSELDMGDKSLDEYIEWLRGKGYLTDGDKVERYNMSLPTMFRANVDWNPFGAIFINAGATINGLGKSQHGARYLNHYYITPRVETRGFTVYSPLSKNGLNQYNWGVGISFGVFFVGSSSVLSNYLFKDKITGADIHFGLSIPIHKRAKKIAAPTVVPENKNVVLTEEEKEKQ